MSGRRSIMNEGVAIVIEDDQRLADDAAAMDDRVTELLLLPGTISPSANTKRVVPLVEEAVLQNNTRGVLLVPSAGTGSLQLLPAWYGAAAVVAGQGLNSTAPLMALAHTQYIYVFSDYLPANSSGSTKYHGVYATIARSVTVTGARLQRNADDVESTQTQNLASATALTLGFTAQSASLAAALAAVPSDSSSAYTFFLGYVVVANGYASHGSVSQDSTGGATYLIQGWDGGGVPQRRLLGQIGSIHAGADAHKPATPFYPSGVSTHRFGPFETMYAGFKNNTGDSNTIVVLDDKAVSGIDWRYRLVYIVGTRAGAASGAHSAPESVTNPTEHKTFAVGPVMTGSGSTFPLVTLTGAGAGSTDVTLEFSVSGGRLIVTVTGNADDASNMDNYGLIIFYSPRFKF